MKLNEIKEDELFNVEIFYLAPRYRGGIPGKKLEKLQLMLPANTVSRLGVDANDSAGNGLDLHSLHDNPSKLPAKSSGDLFRKWPTLMKLRDIIHEYYKHLGIDLNISFKLRRVGIGSLRGDFVELIFTVNESFTGTISVWKEK